jgi:hypothetical protein
MADDFDGSDRDRDTKDDRDDRDRRENGTNGDDRKREFLPPTVASLETNMSSALDSPPPARDSRDDDLDVAE